MPQLQCASLAGRPPPCAASRCPAAAAAGRGVVSRALQQRCTAAGSPTGRRQHWRRRGFAPPVAAIRGVDSFEADFELTEQQSSTLNELLHSELFHQQVVRDCKLPEGAAVEFTGVLFQPRPWTPSETKGMSAELEQRYYGKPDEYTIINVPPVFMFQAKIFQPPRLCAVYKRA
ncbi:hypothetical protein ABPG75_012557 [Micractinium tetrahymenae]